MAKAERTDLQDFPGLVVIFQDYEKIKFQDFPGFQGPVQTLYTTKWVRNHSK